MKTRVGILALQGDVVEHETVLRKLGIEPTLVKLPEDLAKIDRLILPGGESTTIGKLLAAFKLLKPLRSRIQKGMPVWGTCAGAILLSKNIADGIKGQQTIGLMDITAHRNAFGRQLESFESTVDMPVVSKKPVKVFFIRAPIFEKAGKGVEVLAKVGEKIVAAREKNMLITSFHPELAGSTELHEYFLSL